MPRPLSFHLWVAHSLLAQAATVALIVSNSPLLALAAFFSPGPWYLWQTLVPGSRGLGPAIHRFTTTSREVWLTIDDGPDPTTTPRLLDLLDTHRAHATFFVIGEKAARHPELIGEIVRRGHTLGNHTHTHPHASYWLPVSQKTGSEIDRCDAALRAAGVPPPRWFRPPVGIKSLTLHPELAKRDRELVLWSARGFDTRARPPEKIFACILRTLSPGAIILLHESGPPDSPRLALIARLLEHLTRENYTCVIPAPERLIRE